MSESSKQEKQPGVSSKHEQRSESSRSYCEDPSRQVLAPGLSVAFPLADRGGRRAASSTVGARRRLTLRLRPLSASQSEPWPRRLGEFRLEVTGPAACLHCDKPAGAGGVRVSRSADTETQS